MLKVLFRYLFILSVVTGVYSCSRTPQELKTAEQLIENHPDSALHILRNLAPDKYKSGESRALYGFLLFQTLNTKLLPLKPESLLDFSINWYEKHPDPDRLAACLLYKGRANKDCFQYEKAIIYYLKALDEAKNSKDNLLLGRLNSDIADIFTIQSDFIKARQKYTLSYEYFKKSKSYVHEYYSLIDIGISFSHTHDYKTAQGYYHKVYSLANDSMIKGAALDQIGRCYYDANQIDSAFFYLRKVLYYPYLGYNRAKRYNYIASLFLDNNQIDSSYFYAINSFNFNPDIRTKRDCYRILTNSEFRRGNMREMSMYMNKYVNLSDSIRKIDAQIKGSYIETTHIANKKAIKNQYIAWNLGGLVLILIIVGYLLYRLFTHRNRQEKKQIQETHTVEKRVIHKKVIEEKRTVLQKQLEARKKSMLIEYRNAGAQERELQLREIYKELLHFDEPELFFNEMNKFLNRLVVKLKKRHPTLNEKELMLCCYLLLHIPTYDMLILFGYKSDNSLKSLKKRLPKKLNLENATLLEDFLLSILSEN
jgi:tetratricopeptide (TPR) repeat protein